MMDDGLAFESAPGRWVLAVAVLGSGMAFLDGTVVNVALPDIGGDLDASTSALQWIVNGYLLTLASLILLGGSLGDRYGRRRVFVIGVGLFTAASLLCAIAPSDETADRRAVAAGDRRGAADPGQPGDDRGELPPRRPPTGDRRLVGAGGRGDGDRPAARRISDRRGLVAGGVPDQPPARGLRDRRPRGTCPRPATRPPTGRLDRRGALLAALALGGTTYALIEGPGRGLSPLIVLARSGGVAAAIAFVRRRAPRARTRCCRSRCSRRASSAPPTLVTFVVYAAFGGFFFLFVSFLQISLDYSPIAAGAASLPVTALMLLLSRRARGRWHSGSARGSR